MERFPLSPNKWTELLKCGLGLFYADSSSGIKSWFEEVSMDWIRIGDPAEYLRTFRIRIGFGYSFLKTFVSGQHQDIGLISTTKFSWEWFKMWQMMVAVFCLLLYGFCIVSTVCTALITISCNSCYFIVNFFRPSGSSKLLLNCFMLLCLLY